MSNKFNNKDPYSSKILERIKYGVVIGIIIFAIAMLCKGYLWLIN